MHADLALKMLADLISTALLVCAPMLGLTLLVGLVVSILQVVTQIQELSLAFVPKMVAAGVATLAFGSWMLRTLGQYWTQLWTSIPSMF